MGRPHDHSAAGSPESQQRLFGVGVGVRSGGGPTPTHWPQPPGRVIPGRATAQIPVKPLQGPWSETRHEALGIPCFGEEVPECSPSPHCPRGAGVQKTRPDGAEEVKGAPTTPGVPAAACEPQSAEHTPKETGRASAGFTAPSCRGSAACHTTSKTNEAACHTT
mmetsp:Transcript_13069/g.23255  ORF Transcript_13069/g.23255 Transcript_13069/m.23255 type:complete len:164 (+) Transcript_13069:1593-2084(+)